MSLNVDRLICKELPDIPIIAIKSSPRIYLVHAQQVVSLLLNIPDRRVASTALRNFLESDCAKHIKQGGDLAEAFLRDGGRISSMIYTHIFRSGNPSRFATLDGLREIITHLPNQDESAKIKYHGLFNEYFTHLRAPTAFEVATQEQSFHDIEDDDAVPEIQTEGVKGSAHSNDGNTLFVTPKMYVECIINHNETEKKLFQEKLDMAMKTASLEKDKALLQMQLKMQEEKAALQRELDLERLRREYDARMFAPRPDANMMFQAAPVPNANMMLQAAPVPNANMMLQAAPRPDASMMLQARMQWEQAHLAGREPKRAKATEEQQPDPPFYRTPLFLDTSVKFRWLVAYESPEALACADLTDLNATIVTNAARVEGRWVSVLHMTRTKKRVAQVADLLVKLRNTGRITGRAWVENRIPDENHPDKLTIANADQPIRVYMASLPRRMVHNNNTVTLQMVVDR